MLIVGHIERRREREREREEEIKQTSVRGKRWK